MHATLLLFRRRKDIVTVKVCFISRFAYPLFNGDCAAPFGGSEVQIYHFATELAKDKGFHVSLVTGDYGQPEYEKREGVGIVQFPFSGAGPPGAKNLVEYIRLNRCLKEIDADIYVQRAAARLTWIIGRFIRKHRKKFLYMLAHDSESEFEKIFPWWDTFLGRIDWRLFKMGLRYADHAVVQNDYQKSNIDRYFPDKKISIRMSAHRIDPDLRPGEKKSVLWVARSDGFKNPELLLKLAEEMPQIPFVMICTRGNDHALNKKIEERARGNPNIRFLSYVPFREIDMHFREARVFINTSDSEGFPNTFIQAAKTGTPILSYRVDPDGILEKHGIGICAKGNIEKLETDLKMILSDDEIFRKISGAGLQYCMENHDIRRIVEEDKRLLFGLFRS